MHGLVGPVWRHNDAGATKVYTDYERKCAYMGSFWQVSFVNFALLIFNEIIIQTASSGQLCKKYIVN